jgi:hypothetical protein
MEKASFLATIMAAWLKAAHHEASKLYALHVIEDSRCPTQAVVELRCGFRAKVNFKQTQSQANEAWLPGNSLPNKQDQAIIESTESKNRLRP